MVNTELVSTTRLPGPNYNILNIVVNTELDTFTLDDIQHYNILNIVVNTEPSFLI